MNSDRRTGELLGGRAVFHFQVGSKIEDTHKPKLTVRRRVASQRKRVTGRDRNLSPMTLGATRYLDWVIGANPQAGKTIFARFRFALIT